MCCSIAFQVHGEASPFYGIPYSAKALLEEPTKVLQLKNVVWHSLSMFDYGFL
jgi:hypothetical protein